MIDTIAATVVPPYRLDIGLFDAGEVNDPVGEAKPRRDRFWLSPGEAMPRVTYWRYDRADDPGLLKVEFSVPRLSLTPDLRNHNCGVHDVNAVLAFVEVFLRSSVCEDLPELRSWTVQRIDYAYNWRTANRDGYLSALSALSFRSIDRQRFSDGVMWASPTRTVKFYTRDDDVLRFEVSNFRDGCRRLSNWFDCERTVGELVLFGRALYSLSHALDALGLSPDSVIGGDTLLLQRLCDAFGQRHVGTALHVLRCISEHGPAATRAPLSMVSRGMYYGWRRRLIDAGFALSLDDGGGLAPLSLPVCGVMNDELRVTTAPQNLDDFLRAGRLSSQKISLASLEKLQILRAPMCDYLVGSACREAAVF